MTPSPRGSIDSLFILTYFTHTNLIPIKSLVSLQDQDITVHFSDRDSTASADSIFGGSSVDSYVIHCDQIQDTGISRTVDDSLAAT